MNSVHMRAATVIGALVMTGTLVGPAVSATPETSRGCHDVSIPASLVPGTPATEKLAGTICDPAGGPSNVLQILVPGFTENRTYWDWPGFNGRYSYAATMNKAGYSTLAIDELGSGASSHPPGALMTANASAESIHDAVESSRAGTINGHRYSKVALVGHSVGSGVVDIEAATYHDIDALVSTGANHGPGALGQAQITLNMEPAALDPRLHQVVGNDPIYLTTRPGIRGKLLYNRRNTDPAVIAKDEATKDAAPLTQLVTANEFLASTTLINGPVLVAAGEKDHLHCSGGGGLALTNCDSSQQLLNSEKPFFPQADLNTYVLPEAGHDMNLHLNSNEWFTYAATWFANKLPVGDST